MELKSILESKPKTPECPEDEAYGPCLIWTKEGGWHVTRR
jgi:hypothetical protein